MALYRVVHTGFWRDEKVLEEMTPEDKFYFLYLLTNPNTTQVGIYKITKKEMAFELGYSMESINSLLDRFENHHKLIKYNQHTREIAIKNWGKHNLKKAGRPIYDCVKKELEVVKDISLIEYVADSMNKEKIRVIFDDYISKKSFTSRYSIDEECDEKLLSSVNQFTVDNINHHNGVYGGQKEKENKKENKKEKEIQKENMIDDLDIDEENVESKDEGTKYVGKFAKLYEQNIGMINGVAYEWICDISDEIDESLFKKAIEIATDKGKCSKGYVNGIIKQWLSNNIRRLSDYEAFELGKGKGGDFGGYEFKEDEDESIRRPTEDELEEVRKKWLN